MGPFDEMSANGFLQVVGLVREIRPGSFEIRPLAEILRVF